MDANPDIAVLGISPLAPMPAVTRILSRFERDQLASFVTIAIDLLDALDGDSDREHEDPAGETVPIIDDPELEPEEFDYDPDLEETNAEDSFASLHADGPGCPIADSSGDQSWPEWGTRGRHKLALGLYEPVGVHEDDEEDDPAEDDDDDSSIDDGPCDDIDQDLEPEYACVPSYGINQATLPEEIAYGTERSLMTPHRDRIRATRCEEVQRFGTVRYELLRGFQSRRTETD